MNASSLNFRRNDDSHTKRPRRSLTSPPEIDESIMKEIHDSKEKFREQLEGLVRFVQKVEEQSPSDWQMVSVTPLTTAKQSYCSSASSTNLEEEIPKFGAIQDCFKIIKSFLRETRLVFSDLADEIDDKHSLYSNSTTDFDAYFTQYQLQLAFFICTTLCMQIDHCNVGMMKWMKEHFSRLPETDMDVFAYAMHHRFTVVERKCDPGHPSDSTPVKKYKAATREYDYSLVGESPPDLDSDRESHLTLSTPNLAGMSLRSRVKCAVDLLITLSQKLYNWLHNSEKGNRGALKSISSAIMPDKICLDCALKLFKSNDVLCNPCRRSIVMFSKLQDILTSPIDDDVIHETVSKQTETFELNGVFNLNTLAKKVKKGIDKYIENKIELIDQSDLCEDPTDYGESDKIINILIEGFKEASLDPSSYRLTRTATDSDFLKSYKSNAKLFTAESHDEDFAFDSKQSSSPTTEEKRCEQFVEDSIRKAVEKVKILRRFRENVSSVEQDVNELAKPVNEKFKEQNQTKRAGENPGNTKAMK